MRNTGADMGDNPLEHARGPRAKSTNEVTADGNVRGVMNHQARRQEVEALMKMDGLDLAAAEIMRNAWQCCDIDGCAITSVADRGAEPLLPERSP